MGLFAGTKWDLPPTCEACGKPQQQCTCPPCTPVPQWLPAEQQTAQVRVERRKAKRLVTVVAGLSQHESDLGSLLTRLQTACGAGGTQQGDELLLQGDHVVKVSQCLRQCGYRVKA